MLCMLMLVILCHSHCEASPAVVRPNSITTGSRHPVFVIQEANSAVGFSLCKRPALLANQPPGAVTPVSRYARGQLCGRWLANNYREPSPLFLVMQEANSAVGGLPTTTGSRHPCFVTLLML
jgi:hypothetical protein